jgi:hypothetical protein
MIFAIYFFAGLIFIASSFLGFALPLLGIVPSEWIFFVYVTSQVLMFSSTYRIAARFGEGALTRFLFLVPYVGAWVFLLDSILVTQTTRLNNEVFEWLSYVSIALTYLGYLTVVIACFLVKYPGLRASFRFWGRWAGVCFVVYTVCLFAAPGWASDALIRIAFFPVPLILYRAWKLAPELEEEPENPAE